MRLRKILTVGATAVFVMTAAGCSSGNESGSSPVADSDGLTTVTLVGPPAAQLATLVVARDAGIFEEHGFKVELSWPEPAAILGSSQLRV